MSGSFISASEVRMQEIIEYVSSRHPDSLNREGDVELLMLKKVSDLHLLYLLHILHLYLFLSHLQSLSFCYSNSFSFSFNSILISIV